MNTIALQIDYATEQLKALNDLLDAQDRFNAVYGGADTQAIIDAHMRLQRAKLKHAELSGPADYVPPADCEPLNDCGETFHTPRKSYAMHPDDPRRGQAADINRANRGNV
jgi:hypothetical protein